MTLLSVLWMIQNDSVKSVCSLGGLYTVREYVTAAKNNCMVFRSGVNVTLLKANESA